MSDIYQFSEGFQLKILSLMARDRGSFVSYQSVLEPKYFRKAVHIDMARIIHNHYEKELSRAKAKGTEVSPPTMEVLFEEIRKLSASSEAKAKIITQYEDVAIDIMNADLSDAEYLKDNIIRFGRKSALTHAILESVDEIEKNVDDFSGVEERILAAIRVGEDVSDLGVNYFENASVRMTQYESGSDGIRRIPTGMAGLDKTLSGGLGDGELGVIIAPPNRGKSIALTNIGAGAVLEGYNVVHYTLEMPERQVERRYDNRFTKKSLDYLKENSNNALTAVMNIQKMMKGDLVIKKFRTNECTVDTLRSHLTRLHMEKGFKPDLIIVDYGDLIQPKRTYKDKRFELESVYLDLRDLGSEYGCPVWTASQANRGSLDKKVITIGDLAEAFNKANIADFMIALCQTVEEKEDGVMRWHVAKNRSGVANITLDGDIDYPTMTMSVYDAG